MLETGRQGKLETKVEPQPAIRTGVTASAIAHLSILALVMLLSDVHPFHAVTAETIAVDMSGAAKTDYEECLACQ